MFTGIIECLGTIEKRIESGSNVDLIVSSPISKELKVDQSIAHNGVCLTVVHCADGRHTVTVIKESLDRSIIGDLDEGDLVNLERCLTMNGRLDGHMVQGHVDTTVECTQVIEEDGSWRYRFRMPDQAQLLVPKGSICINGVSLTISDLGETHFEVSIIPYTFEHTTFSLLRTGMRVNIEYDVLGKYVERNLALR